MVKFGTNGNVLRLFLQNLKQARAYVNFSMWMNDFELFWKSTRILQLHVAQQSIIDLVSDCFFREFHHI